MTEAITEWAPIEGPSWAGVRSRLTDCSPTSVLYAAQLIILYGICDYATTIIGYRLGAYERNPVVRWVLGEYGAAGFALVKATAVVILLALLGVYFALLAFARAEGVVGPRLYLLYRHAAPLALLAATGWVVYTNVAAILYHLPSVA